ncbi:MAG: heavy-metal-associated domain-containing protein [Clostridia bacterium]|nr:heavy-metal-associated domain-containing protein [Clostridia bacterium]
MKKVYKMEDLECAHCAAKMEKGIMKLSGVVSCSISFLSQKMKLEIEDSADPDAIMKEIAAIVKKIEPDCKVIF